MMHLLILSLLLSLSLISSITVPVVIDSGMVLQRSPLQARLWGWGTAGETVTVTLDNTPAINTTVTSSGTWTVNLAAQSASRGRSIVISAASGSKTLSNVAFGDVWLCSGQSNMQMSVNDANNAQAEIDDSVNYPDLRYFTEQLVASSTPLTTMGTQANYNWGTGPNAFVGVGKGDFSWPSATCYFFGRQVYKSLGGNVPIGLVAADWGGTRVEAWSSPDALAECGASEPPPKPNSEADPNDASALWNGMIYPLLNMRFYGATWYQGEANAGNPTGYQCTFPAMIKDWRQKFGLALPFFFVVLAGFPDGGGAYPYIRDAQLSALALPQTGFAQGIDLGDPSSPYGSIHPRRKQEVGRRLALSALAIAYNQTGFAYLGPTLSNLTLTQPTTSSPTASVTLTFTSASTLHTFGTGGCTTCCNESPLVFVFENGTTVRVTYSTDATNGVVKASVSATSQVASVSLDYEDFPQCAFYNGQGGPDDASGIAVTPFRYSTPPKSYSLVLRQTVPYYYTKGQWSLNPNDPANNNYAILDTLANLKPPYQFKLRWPTAGSQNIWKQTSNPVTTTNGTVSGYTAIQVNHTDQGWGGLKYNTYGECLLDGSVGQPGNWYYAIGSFAPWNNGIPSWGPAKQQVELYVQKDRTDGWTLVFRQTYPYFARPGQWSVNSDNPASDSYSILDKLESYRNSDGAFYFKLYWPEDDQNIWIQTNNPVTTKGVTGYQAVSVFHSENNWGGLQFDDGPDALLDGSATSTTGLWYYAIGSTHSWSDGTNTGIPSWGPAQQQAELYVRV